MDKVTLPRVADVYTGARAVPQFIGRRAEIATIQRAIDAAPRSHIFYITGDGGIGKTRLIREILARLQQNEALLTCVEPIDLYHTSTHTVEGLIDALQHALAPDGQGFERYLSARDKLYALDPFEDVDTARLRSLRQSLSETFMADYKDLAGRSIVLALDTAERLFFQQGLTMTALDIKNLQLGYDLGYDWLVYRFLPELQNTVVLLAGRFERGRLFAKLQDRVMPSVPLTHLKLKGFSEAEALEYFEAVIEQARSAGDDTERVAAEMIAALDEPQRRGIFYSLREDDDEPQVRPIRLALAIDHLVVQGKPMPELVQPLADAQQLSAPERAQIQDKLGRALVFSIGNYRRQVDELILMLGWLRKGAGVDLLASVLEQNPDEVERGLADVRALSFVKRYHGSHHPEAERYWLHDEIYRWLRQYILGRLSAPRRAAVFQKVHAYYQRRIEEARAEVAELARSGPERALRDMRALIDKRVKLETLLIDDLYYCLQSDPRDGLNTFFRYSEEAIAARDESLDMKLRAELLLFLGECNLIDGADGAQSVNALRQRLAQLAAGPGASAPTEPCQAVEALLGEIVADQALRWIKRAVYDARYPEAELLCRKLRRSHKWLLEHGGPLVAAELDVWEGLTVAYQGYYRDAETCLKRGQRALEAWQMTVPTDQIPVWSAVLARAHHNLGYLYRVRGQVSRSAQAYQRARGYWKVAQMETQHAATLDHLGQALALQGRFEEARYYVSEALEHFRRRGAFALQAQAYTHLADIENQAANYLEATRHINTALMIARVMTQPRIEGLALLTSAATRRYMSESPTISDAERQRLIELAQKESAEASVIFGSDHRSLKVPDVVDKESDIRAEHDKGVAYRELYRLTRDPNLREQYLAQTITSLEKTRETARTEKLWNYDLDALLGLAWTYYYAALPAELQRTLAELDDEMKAHFPHYRLTPGGVPKRIKDMQVGVVNQFSKFFMLRGLMAMDRYQPHDPARSDALEEAAYYLTLSMAYNNLLAQSHQGIVRALFNIQPRLNDLDKRDLVAFFEAVEQAGQDLRLSRSQNRLWEELVNTFGPYDILKRLTG